MRPLSVLWLVIFVMAGLNIVHRVVIGAFGWGFWANVFMLVLIAMVVRRRNLRS